MEIPSSGVKKLKSTKVYFEYHCGYSRKYADLKRLLEICRSQTVIGNMQVTNGYWKCAGHKRSLEICRSQTVIENMQVTNGYWKYAGHKRLFSSCLLLWRTHHDLHINVFWILTFTKPQPILLLLLILFWHYVLKMRAKNLIWRQGVENESKEIKIKARCLKWKEDIWK